MRKPRAKATKIRSNFLKLAHAFASWEPTCRTPFTQNGMKSTRLRASPLSHSSERAFPQPAESFCDRAEESPKTRTERRRDRDRWILTCGEVSFLIGGRRALNRWSASFEGFFYEAKDGAAVLGDGFGPGEAAHLREIDAAEAEAGDEDIDAVADGLVGDGGYSVGDGLRAVGFGPAVLHLGVSFGDGHLEGCVGHGKGDELLPVFGAGQAAGGFEAFVERRGGERREQAEDGQAWRPSLNLVQGALGYTGGVVVHAKDEGGDGEDVALGEALEHGGILTGLVETFVDVFEVGGVDGLHADEDPLATRGGDEVDEFFVAQEIGADLGDPMHLGVGSDDVAEQGLGALDVDGEIVVNEKYGDLTTLAAGARFQEQELIHDTFVGAKSDGVAEEAGYGAKLAPVRTAAPGLNGNNAEGSPTGAEFSEHGSGELGNDVELIEVDGVPGDRRIRLQRGLLLLAEGIDGSVDILERLFCGIVDDFGPSLVGFTESDGVGMARTAGAAERFVGHFGDVGPAHDHGHADRADGVSHAIGLGDHTGHRADADEPDVLFQHKASDAVFIHGLGVAIDKQHFMSGGSERLEEKHPKMRHEVAGDAVIGVVKQNSHRPSFLPRVEPRYVTRAGDDHKEPPAKRKRKAGCARGRGVTVLDKGCSSGDAD